jgi:hypothetical protein
MRTEDGVSVISTLCCGGIFNRGWNGSLARLRLYDTMTSTLLLNTGMLRALRLDNTVYRVT